MLTSKLLRINVNALKRFLWTVESRGDDLVLKEDDKVELRYPHLWLRDNCQCPSCFHKTSSSRVINIEQFKFDSQPIKTSISELALDVSWSDNHQSHYSLPWLLARQFSPHTQAEWLHTSYRPSPRPWTAPDFQNILQRFTFQDILERDEVLLRWLESLAVDGVALVEGAGTETGKLQPLANRVAFLKQTYYGETFAVRAKPGTSNVAYLSGPLQLHTDLPYYHYKPGVNMLHCVTQGEGEGGESQLADGLAVCDWLREYHPHHYWILSTVPVEWEDIVIEDDKEYHSIYRAPVICEEPGGEVVRINWSQPQRSSHFCVPVDQVTPWYRALQLFTQHMHSIHSKVLYKMSPGEILTFNNIRVFHGRSTYRGDRHLEGGYLDWDYVYSRIRVLRKHQDTSSQSQKQSFEEYHLQGPYE
uniref:Gamma-butyrobetaine dioxygenase n=1 Tax=Cuerna arida TaxID=1464854 RepID=A0A1B6F0H0_9HEMI